MMRIIRYFLSHIVLLVFFAALALAYFYRTHLFSDDVNAQVDNLVHKAMVTVGIPAEKPDPAAKANQEITVAANETAEETTEVKTENSVTTESPDVALETSQDETASAEPTSETAEVTGDAETTDSQEAAATTEQNLPEAQATATADTASGATSEAEQVASSDISNADASTNEVPTEPTESKPAQEEVQVEAKSEVTEVKPEASTRAEVAKEDKQIEVAKTETPATVAVDSDKEATKPSNSDLLNQARLAFQMQQADKSISLYQELADLNPDDPNVHGEMGNVFYAQGKWKMAGAAYYEAASRLLKQGNTGQVQYLYRVIQGLDKDSAEKLRAQLGQ